MQDLTPLYALEQIPHYAVTTVVGLGIDTIHMAHEARQIRQAGLQHEMVVVAHEAVRVEYGVESLNALPDHVEQGLAVGIILEDRFAPIPSCGDVVQRAFKL